MERGVTAALARLEAGDPRVAESQTERRARYQGLPRNIHRHLVMSEQSEAVAQLPAELKQQPSLAWDPLPPANSINTYVAPPRQPTAIDDPSALRMFFRSLLPNFNPDDPLQPAEEAVAGAEGGPGGADLRNSVNSLLDAMRDLLGNLQLPEVPAEAGDEASEGEEEPRDWD